MGGFSNRIQGGNDAPSPPARVRMGRDQLGRSRRADASSSAASPTWSATLCRTRTAEGRSRAQKRGQHMGRPPKLTEAQKAEARRRRATGRDACRTSRAATT